LLGFSWAGFARLPFILRADHLTLSSMPACLLGGGGDDPCLRACLMMMAVGPAADQNRAAMRNSLMISGRETQHHDSVRFCAARSQRRSAL
jgi:hypothetical protein